MQENAGQQGWEKLGLGSEGFDDIFLCTCCVYNDDLMISWVKGADVLYCFFAKPVD